MFVDTAVSKGPHRWCNFRGGHLKGTLLLWLAFFMSPAGRLPDDELDAHPAAGIRRIDRGTRRPIGAMYQ
jgi:hypothetical protein